MSFIKDKQYYKFCFYGFLKNLRFFDAFFLLFLKHKGLTYTEIGSLYAIREITTNLAEIPTGILADTYGRKNALVFSFLTYIFSFILFYAGQDYWLFLAAFILYGIADAFRSGTHKAMIMHYLKVKGWRDQKINYYGHTRACSQRGSALSALIAGIMVFRSGNYNWIFLGAIFPYLLNLLLILSYPNYLNTSQSKNRKKLRSKLKELGFILKNPGVLRIVHSAAVFTAYQKAIKDYIQPVMKKAAVTLPVLIGFQIEKKTGLIIGIMYFILYLLSAKASSLSGKFAKKYPDAAYITLLIGFSLGILAGIFYRLQWWLIALLVFTGIYIIQNLRKPILTGYLADLVPNENLASVISAQSLYRSLLTAVLAVSFGFIADYIDIGYALVIISSILLFISIFTERKKLF